MSAPIRVIDEDAAASELAVRSSEPRPDPDHWEIALTMLSFVEPGAYQDTQVRPEYVDSYYTPETGVVSIVEHATRRDAAVVNQLLVRELVHAAQDQEVGLEAFMAVDTTSDASLSARALVDGEANLYGTLVSYGLNGIDPAEVDLALVFDEGMMTYLSFPCAAGGFGRSPYLEAYGSLALGFGTRCRVTSP